MVMLNPQGAINCLWSMAKLQWQPQNESAISFVDVLLQDIANKIFSKTYEFPLGPTEVSTIIFCLALLDKADCKWLFKIFQAINIALPQMQNYELAMVLWSLNKLRCVSTDILQQTEKIILKEKMTFSAQSISSILCCYADLGVNSQEIVEYLVNQFMEIKGINNIAAACSVIFAMGISNTSLELAQKITDDIMAVVQRDKRKRINPNGFYQLRQAQMFFMANGKQLVFPAQVQTGMTSQTVKVVQQQSTKTKKLVHQMYEPIAANFEGTTKRKVLNNGELVIDIEILHNNTKIAVLVVTKEYYTTAWPPKYLGTLRALQKYLQFLEYEVVVATDREWEGDDREQRFVERINKAINSAPQRQQLGSVSNKTKVTTELAVDTKAAKNTSISKEQKMGDQSQQSLSKLQSNPTAQDQPDKQKQQDQEIQQPPLNQSHNSPTAYNQSWYKHNQQKSGTQQTSLRKLQSSPSVNYNQDKKMQQKSGDSSKNKFKYQKSEEKSKHPYNKFKSSTTTNNKQKQYKSQHAWSKFQGSPTAYSNQDELIQFKSEGKQQRSSSKFPNSPTSNKWDKQKKLKSGYSKHQSTSKFYSGSIADNRYDKQKKYGSQSSQSRSKAHDNHTANDKQDKWNNQRKSNGKISANAITKSKQKQFTVGSSHK
eukprot:TRINITY_DN3313_c0_g1_i2.p1 TRINITY_DN3313_c0_g1~~TRINITY_DN3313_c0_g1_i2.p1  ORF type:complete len:654 (+),score=39.87 TRINITY_DN3313_c0_g1_i2:85-2046(+)